MRDGSHSASLRLPLSTIFMEGGEAFVLGLRLCLFATLASVGRTSVVSRALPLRDGRLGWCLVLFPAFASCWDTGRLRNI